MISKYAFAKNVSYSAQKIVSKDSITLPLFPLKSFSFQQSKGEKRTHTHSQVYTNTQQSCACVCVCEPVSRTMPMKTGYIQAITKRFPIEFRFSSRMLILTNRKCVQSAFRKCLVYG